MADDAVEIAALQRGAKGVRKSDARQRPTL
jgi:hypothetical protein